MIIQVLFDVFIDNLLNVIQPNSVILNFIQYIY